MFLDVFRQATRFLEKLFDCDDVRTLKQVGGGGREFNIPGGAGPPVGLAVLVWLASGFYIVDAGERGVVLRFGKYAESTMPGPRWHLPYPVEAVEVVNVEQVRTVEVGFKNSVKTKVLSEALMLTDD